MILKNYHFNEKNIGYYYEDEKYFLFFSNKFIDKEDLKIIFPQWDFAFLKQTHSDILVEATNLKTIKADAHWSQQKRLATVISTADCLPILLIHKDLILAVHAGWKGVLNQILIKSLKQLNIRNNIKIYIGPHIQKSFFEVGTDVSDQLAKTVQTSADQFVLPHKNQDKRRVCLKTLTKIQLNEQGLDLDKLWVSDTDTFSHQQYYSYREDKTTGRQTSFLVQK